MIRGVLIALLLSGASAHAKPKKARSSGEVRDPVDTVRLHQRSHRIRVTGVGLDEIVCRMFQRGAQVVPFDR